MARRGHEFIVQLLLDKRSNLEANTNRKETPLFWVALNKYEEVIRLLLEKGVDSKAKDKSS
jgi:ankyrin repeat protein